MRGKRLVLKIETQIRKKRFCHNDSIEVLTLFLQRKETSDFSVRRRKSPKELFRPAVGYTRYRHRKTSENEQPNDNEMLFESSYCDVSDFAGEDGGKLLQHCCRRKRMRIATIPC